MTTILDFAPDDELKKYFWESDWYYMLSDDSDDEVHLEKVKTKIRIERCPNVKKKTMEFSLLRFDDCKIARNCFSAEPPCGHVVASVIPSNHREGA